MIIEEIALFRYRLPFRTPLCLATGVLKVREGFLLRLQNDQGAVGWGEISLLPGVSRESWNDMVLAFRELPKLRGCSIQETDWHAVLKLHWLQNQPFASIQFGLDSAFIQLFAANQGGSLRTLLLPDRKTTVRINALVTETDPIKIISTAVQKATEGYKTIKLKVGRRSPTIESDMIRSVRQNISSDITLRLDANRQWSLSEAIEFSRLVGPEQIEYIEEPLRSPLELPDFVKQTGMPIALDESLISGPPQPAELVIAAYILKPGILGGVATIMAFSHLARRKKILPVLSSPFHTAVGLQMTLFLALDMAVGETAMGLDTFNNLAEDFVSEPLAAEQGFLNLEHVEQRLHIEETRLKRII
ncbi:MAG: o-succinylbenzoate synthase [Calditrichaeota bacterium]|nr:MAG: o-succinylbenzoate synthase [Calditrichota bacterium]